MLNLWPTAQQPRIFDRLPLAAIYHRLDSAGEIHDHAGRTIAALLK